MNNKLFNSQVSNVPAANARNHSGGTAYSLPAQVSLAKYCVCGVFQDTYQTDAEEQLERVLKLCNQSEPEFIAKLAVYSRIHSRMKLTPAFLVAYLARNNIDLCKRVFPKVINDGKMLRNFIQILRSGVIGTSRSLGTASKKLVQNYLNSLSDEQLFKADVGNDPSLPDIIKMMHPKPETKEREALYAYLLGKKPKQECDKDLLLPLAREFEAFKKGESKAIPNVPFQMLTSLPLTTEHWKEIARNATFNQIRINLNTFKRHGVLEDQELVDLIAARLSDPDEVRRSRVLPYQLFTTFMNIDSMPQKISNALQAAVEVALENVPVIEGEIYIALDTSGSMRHKLTGNRGSVSTKTRYIDVAALFAAAILRKNKNAVILPFDTEVNAKNVVINPFDSIMTNAQKLAAINGGGTDCSCALSHLNEKNAKGSAVIYISDNESWRYYAGKTYGGRAAKGTGMMHEWEKFVKRNPGAKLVNIDMTPSDTTQVANTPNTLLVAGFSDFVFDVVAGYFRGADNDDYWLGMINDIKL